MSKTIAMQETCIYCRREQYKPAVYEISNGKHPCIWCGITPPVLTQEEYEKKLLTLKSETDEVN